MSHWLRKQPVLLQNSFRKTYHLSERWTWKLEHWLSEWMHEHMLPQMQELWRLIFSYGYETQNSEALLGGLQRAQSKLLLTKATVAPELDYTMWIFIKSCSKSSLNINEKARKWVLRIGRSSVVCLKKWLLQESAFSGKISHSININYVLYYSWNHTWLKKSAYYVVCIYDRELRMFSIKFFF